MLCNTKYQKLKLLDTMFNVLQVRNQSMQFHLKVKMTSYSLCKDCKVIRRNIRRNQR
jgi:hypothetical protein